MTARIIIRDGVSDRENYWQGDNDLLAVAIERAFRKRLTSGKSVYFATTAAFPSERAFGTIIIAPTAFVSFSYTEYDGTGDIPLLDVVEALVERDGGVTLDVNDELVIDQKP